VDLKRDTSGRQRKIKAKKDFKVRYREKKDLLVK
jgi:hypothetical protein